MQDSPAGVELAKLTDGYAVSRERKRGSLQRDIAKTERDVRLEMVAARLAAKIVDIRNSRISYRLCGQKERFTASAASKRMKIGRHPIVQPSELCGRLNGPIQHARAVEFLALNSLNIDMNGLQPVHGRPEYPLGLIKFRCLYELLHDRQMRQMRIVKGECG